MAGNYGDTGDYYAGFFAENPSYATPFPNLEEAYRWSKICEFLSQIPQAEVHGVGQRLRILDVGCGRGWLTYLASIYGRCDGVDPSAGAIELARRHFPGLTFHVGTVANVLQSSNFEPYDVVVASEVIEHVTDKQYFVAKLSECLVSNGHVIITTPRGEEFQKYWRSGHYLQPIEAWISEKELCSLFEHYRFVPIEHDRVYIDLPEMSLLHRLSASPKFSHALNRLGLAWIHKGLQYLTAFYQVWCFQLRKLPA